MPTLEYLQYYGPEYTLHVPPISNMKNKNKRRHLDEIRAHVLGNLSKLQHAPSVQFQERPPDTEFQEADHEDDGNGRWDSDDVDPDFGPEF